MQLLPYLLWNTTIQHMTTQYPNFRYYDYTVPLFRFAGRRELIESQLGIGRSKELAKKNIYKGFRGKDLKWNESSMKNRKEKGKLKVIIDPITRSLFEQFVTEYKNMNIHLIMVYTPEHVNGHTFVENRQLIFDYFQHLSSEYDVAFFDYSRDSISFDKTLFYNTSHLNRRGADLFTQKLADTLLSLGTYNHLVDRVPKWQSHRSHYRPDISYPFSWATSNTAERTSVTFGERS